jgi:hypothetical protein
MALGPRAAHGLCCISRPKRHPGYGPLSSNVRPHKHPTLMQLPKFQIRQPTAREWQFVALLSLVNVIVFGALGMLWHTASFGMALLASALLARRAKRAEADAD